MPFVKAVPKQGFAKILIYGWTGGGKSLTALMFAEGLAKREGKRVAYVDTEFMSGGVDYYMKKVVERECHPEAFDFDHSTTRSLFTVIEDIASLDPKVYGVVVIDSISHLWDAAIEAYEGKKVGKQEDKIPISAWAAIKKPYKALIRTLLDAPYHVIVCGRQKALYEDDAAGDMKKVGFTVRAEGETQYDFPIQIRMECPKGSKDVFANFENDKSSVLKGKTLPNPTFATLAPVLAYLDSEARVSEDPDDVAANDSQLLSVGAEKAKAKEDKSEALYATLQAAVGAANDLQALLAISVTMKKERKHLIDTHEEALRILYAAKHKSLAAKAAPSEV